MRRAARGLVAAFAASLLVGCGLPVERGVRTPDAVFREGDGVVQGSEGGTAFLAPGWRPGLQPAGVVRGFLQAQGSPDDDHAIARDFLDLDTRQEWNDDAEVLVYDPSTLEAQVVGDETGDTVQVRLRGTVTSRISAAGTLNPADGVLDDTYSLRRDADRNWLLTDVPDGLRLRPADVARSYTTQFVYYLAKGTGAQGHLVPDPTLLLLEKEAATILVRRLVAGPSASLQGAVVTAVPAGTEVVSVTSDAGLVTVDLGPRILRLTPVERERLSAQLVWTLREALPTFAELRLLSDGRPVEVPGVDGDVQDRSAWESYDPDGLPDRVTTYYVSDRRLRTLETDGAPVPAVANTAVDRAAVDPRTDDLALLTDVGEGRWEVRIGPLSGPLADAPLYTGGGLRSPSWGGGRRGLWLLRTAGDPQVLLLERTGRVHPVPVLEAPPGRITALRVSRDGARIALVIGEDDASRRVYVAQVIDDAGGLRIGRPREVGSGVTDVSDVAWGSATSLVALGRFNNLEPLPLRLAIDGSGAVDLVRQPGLEQFLPMSLAAGPDRPLVVAASREGRPPVLLRSSGGVFAEDPNPGYAPFYPG